MRRRLALLATAFVLPLPVHADDNPLGEWLELAGWSEEQLTEAANEAPLTEPTQSRLLGLADRFRRLPESLLRAPADEALDTPTAREPGAAVELEGRAVGVRRLGASGFEIRARLPSDDSPRLTILTNAAPAAWMIDADQPLDEPFQLRGLVVAWNDNRRLVVAPRVAWRPVSAASPRVGLGLALLGQAGVDVGLLDNLADGKPMTAADAEPFYLSLAACRRYRAAQLLRVAGENLPAYAAEWESELSVKGPKRLLARAVLARAGESRYSVAPLFNDAAAQRGELVAFEGVARRAVRIDLSLDKEGRPSQLPGRYGFDHYYEVEVFPEDSQNLPLVFCLLELPDGFPVGDALFERVRLAGFFLKRWAYRTRKPNAEAPGEDRRQLAPLLVGSGLVRLPPAAENTDTNGQLLAGAAFVVGLGVVVAALWRQACGDRRFERLVLSRYQSAGGFGNARGDDPAAPPE